MPPLALVQSPEATIKVARAKDLIRSAPFIDMLEWQIILQAINLSKKAGVVGGEVDVVVATSVLASQLGITKDSAKNLTLVATTRLFNRSFSYTKIEANGSETFCRMRWVGLVSRTNDDAETLIRFTDDTCDLLALLSNDLLSLMMLNSSGVRQVPSWRLYQLISLFRDQPTPLVMPILEFRAIMGMDQRCHKGLFRLKEHMEKAIVEMAVLTDLDVKYQHFRNESRELFVSISIIPHVIRHGGNTATPFYG